MGEPGNDAEVVEAVSNSHGLAQQPAQAVDASSEALVWMELCQADSFHPLVQQTLTEHNVTNNAVLNLFQQLARASPPRAARLLLKILQLSRMENAYP